MGSGSGFSFKSLVLVSLVAAWASWLGYNGMVSIPAYLLMGAVFITDAQPGSAIFESWRWVTETSAGFLVPKPHWNVVEYTFKEGESFDFEHLRKLSAGFTRPVVFRGMAKDLAILEQWNDPSYFMNNPKYADTEVLVVQNAKLHQQWSAARNATAYGSEVNKGGLFQAKPMRLGEAIQRMLDGENMYVQNVDSLARKHKEFVEQLEFDRLLANWRGNQSFNSAICQWFMGVGKTCNGDVSQSSGTSMHCAYAGNIFYQLVGQKHWTFVEPEYSPYLLAHYETHVFAGFAREIPDWIPRAKTILYQGDVLYNPPWFWHEVANGEGWTMAAANRVIFPTAAMKNQPFAHFMSDLFSDPFTHNKLMYKDKPVRRLLLATPVVRTLAMLALGDGHVERTSTANWCDEHNPAGCHASFDQSLWRTPEFQKEAGLA